MPNIKSAKKRVLVSQTKARIDQAAAKGLIHKKNAAHKKSALVCKLNGAKA